MNNMNWDMTIAVAGEMLDYDENAMMEELYKDPEFLVYLDARNAEAVEHQMAQDAIEHPNS